MSRAKGKGNATLQTPQTSKQDASILHMWSSDNTSQPKGKTQEDLQGEGDTLTHFQQPPSREDMQAWFQDLQDKFMSTVQEQFTTMKNDMKQVVQDIKVDMAKLEERTDIIGKTIQSVEEETQQVSQTQKHLARLTHNLEIQCEDLENRSRRSNIRIKNLAESVLDKDLKMAVKEVFREVLEAQDTEVIGVDSVHRVGPKRSGAPGERPRDVLVALSSYPQKEQILRKAREMEHIRMNGQEIQLYQDLALVAL